MKDFNCNYDEIVLSEEKVKFLAGIASEKLTWLMDLGSVKIPEMYGSISAAADIVQIYGFFNVAVFKCLAVMKDDWNAIMDAILKKVELERFMSESIKESAPTSGSQVVSQIHSGKYYNIADFVGAQLGLISSINSNKGSFGGFVIEHEYIKVSSGDIAGIGVIRVNMMKLLMALEEYSQAVKAFVDTDMFRGDFADAVKDYLRTAHLAIVDKFFDLARTIRKLGEDYSDSYKSAIGDTGFKIDEKELLNSVKRISSACDVISQKIYSGNKLVELIKDGSEGEVRLSYYPCESFSQADYYVTVCRNELRKMRDIEDTTSSKLKVLIVDSENLYRFSRMLKKHSGFDILSADVGKLKAMSSKISTKYELGAMEYLDDINVCLNGKVDPAKRDKLLEIIRKDPAFSDRLDLINSASPDEIDGMIKYFTCLRVYLLPGEGTRDLDRALNVMERNGEWIAELYRAGNGENDFLKSASNYVYAAEHSPDDVIAGAMEWAKTIAGDDEHHGYPYGNSLYSRWGADYDCSSFVVSAYQIGGGLDSICGRENDIRTASMVDQLTQNGFSAIRIDDDFTIDQLREGDIIMRDVGENGHGSHAEIYTDGGRTIHATFMSYDNTAVGDQTLQSIEETEGYDLQRYLDEFKNNKFGTNYTPDNYVNEDGLSVVGEICGHMVAAPDSNTFTYEPGEEHWQYVLRYTGGA